jgi:hypothetical protein
MGDMGKKETIAKRTSQVEIFFLYTKYTQQTHTHCGKSRRKKNKQWERKRLFSSSPKHNVHNEQLGYNFLFAIVDG